MTLMQSGPVQLPEQSGDALRYLGLLIEQMQFALEEIDRSFYSVSYAAPDRPRDFMLRFADGTTWNPGSGQGLYQYYNGSWRLLSGLARYDAKMNQTSSAQAITEGTWTSVQMDTEEIDTAAMVALGTSNTKITLTAAGLYLVTGCVGFAPGSVPTTELPSRRAAILKNSSWSSCIVAGGDAAADGVYNTRSIVTSIARFAANDTIELSVFWNFNGGSGSLNTLADGYSTFLAASRLWV